MTERRALIEGLKPASNVDTRIEQQFVFQGKPPAASDAPPVATPVVVARAPISTRIQADYATALKRASLERQLAGIEPHRLQDILEEALEPWLRNNGYLS